MSNEYITSIRSKKVSKNQYIVKLTKLVKFFY